MVKLNKDDADDRFDRLEAKIDELLRFKWQVIGGSLIISTLVTVLIQMLTLLVKLK